MNCRCASVSSSMDFDDLHLPERRLGVARASRARALARRTAFRAAARSPSGSTSPRTPPGDCADRGQTGDAAVRQIAEHAALRPVEQIARAHRLPALTGEGERFEPLQHSGLERLIERFQSATRRRCRSPARHGAAADCTPTPLRSTATTRRRSCGSTSSARIAMRCPRTGTCPARPTRGVLPNAAQVSTARCCRITGVRTRQVLARHEVVRHPHVKIIETEDIGERVERALHTIGRCRGGADQACAAMFATSSSASTASRACHSRDRIG